LSEYFDIPQVDYIILEGVSSFHPDISQYVDYKIWLDVSADAAKNRMMKRDKRAGKDHGEALWSHWTDSYQAYKDLHQPEVRADAIIDPADLGAFSVVDN
jgi:uridine kinase